MIQLFFRDQHCHPAPMAPDCRKKSQLRGQGWGGEPGGRFASFIFPQKAAPQTTRLLCPPNDSLFLSSQVSGSKIWQTERSCMCCQESGVREATVTLVCPKATGDHPKFRKVGVPPFGLGQRPILDRQVILVWRLLSQATQISQCVPQNVLLLASCFVPNSQEAHNCRQTRKLPYQTLVPFYILKGLKPNILVHVKQGRIYQLDDQLQPI